MEFGFWHLIFFIAAVIGTIIITVLAIYGINVLRRSDAQSQIKEMLRLAELDAENKRREAELQIKEQTIQLKEKYETDVREMRQEMHERERSLDKRQDAIDK